MALDYSRNNAIRKQLGLAPMEQPKKTASRQQQNQAKRAAECRELKSKRTGLSGKKSK